SGSATRRRSRSSPRSNSRRASSPITKKKKAMRPELIQSRRSSEMPEPPTRIESVVVHTRSYEAGATVAQMSAAATAGRRTAALPVSVRRKERSGVWRLRLHAVRPLNGAAETSVSAIAEASHETSVRPRSADASRLELPCLRPPASGAAPDLTTFQGRDSGRQEQRQQHAEDRRDQERRARRRRTGPASRDVPRAAHRGP